MMTEAPVQVRIREGVDQDVFRDEIVPAGEPVLLKGLVSDWPAVRAGRDSPEAMADYLLGFDSGQAIETILGTPEIGGRFFYNDDMSGLNFTRKPRKLAESLRELLEFGERDEPPSIYVQSVPVDAFLPGFARDNSLACVGANAPPRIWIGNRVTVQTHFDLKENVACVVAGRRRFTVFPPSQTPNLYPGPFELTLSGPPVSMVRFDAPDLERYPRFREALAQARYADLEPGDALYIPYFWWHHVQAHDGLNVLVNYWWNDANADLGSPFDAMLHAILSVRDLPERQRAAWQTMFEHYVFGAGGDATAHLPATARGILGEHDKETRKTIRKILLAVLARQAGLRPPGGG
jgi:hypothetical protein